MAYPHFYSTQIQPTTTIQDIPHRFSTEDIPMWSSLDSTRLDNIRRATGHPYARLYAKKGISKRHRKIWNHALEKSLFDSNELATMGAPNRRSIYVASLEAHVDNLHAQLLTLGLYPVPFEKLEPYKGLNSKTAKSMVAGLQHDISLTRIKLLELERSNDGLKQILEERRHSVPYGEPGWADSETQVASPSYVIN